MKRFRVALLQLEAVSPNTVLQAIKQAIRQRSQFFDSLSLQPLASVDELCQELAPQYSTRLGVQT